LRKYSETVLSLTQKISGNLFLNFRENFRRKFLKTSKLTTPPTAQRQYLLWLRQAEEMSMLAPSYPALRLSHLKMNQQSVMHFTEVKTPFLRLFIFFSRFNFFRRSKIFFIVFY